MMPLVMPFEGAGGKLLHYFECVSLTLGATVTVGARKKKGGLSYHTLVVFSHYVHFKNLPSRNCFSR